METFKAYTEILKMDERHGLLGQVTGQVLSLPGLHEALEGITLHDAVPESVQGQFNVARNMALYSYFCYSLAPEVQMKTYAVTELALRERLNGGKRGLRSLLKQAVDDGLLSDAGFRHVPHNPENPYVKSLPKVLSSLRNSAAHGSTLLLPQCVGHIEKSADLINQLFSDSPRHTP